MIQERFAQGVYVKDIAAELGVHPRTISRALRCSGAPSGRRPAARKSKLDPYQPMIDQLLDQGVWNAQVILREIQAAGYPGKRSILSAYIAPSGRCGERAPRCGLKPRRVVSCRTTGPSCA